MVDNSTRRTRQKELDIRVILGNPPYSVGQGSANDNAANLAYSKLDGRIRETYAARSDATNKNALYDSYIRAMRWASDRIGDAGIIAFVSNAGWVDGNTTAGLRQCFAEEFASIHVFHLRGNQRTSGERSRREGGKVFGSGSRTPVAITVLVKNSAAMEQGTILFHDIGDYLTREEKLAKVAKFGSLGGISAGGEWQQIQADEHGDWLKQRDSGFEQFLPMGSKDGSSGATIFENYSRGVATARDAWAYNFSALAVSSNISAMATFYNSELDRFAEQHPHADRKAREEMVGSFVNSDATRISWNRGLKSDFVKGRRLNTREDAIVQSIYRPFTRQYLYFDRSMNDMIYQMPRLFQGGSAPNRAIMVKQRSPEGSQFALMLDRIPELQTDGGAQCFPRYLYDDEPEAWDQDLLSVVERGPTGDHRRDAITDAGLSHFQKVYPDQCITKDDLFHYVYGILHSEEYRERFADNLSKELPRIPTMKRAEDFWAFVEAGRKLGELHIGYDSVAPYPVTIKEGDLRLANIQDPQSFYRVEQMRFAGKRPKLDKTTVVYNSNITMTGIPLAAYEYVVNGRPALEWVMERQVVKTDKDSGIVNDANRYAIETVGDPAYPLKLFQRIITVSLETMKIVHSLPQLDILEPTKGPTNTESVH